jgi:hypothetical protein
MVMETKNNGNWLEESIAKRVKEAKEKGIPTIILRPRLHERGIIKIGRLEISDTLVNHKNALEYLLPVMSVFLPIHIEVIPHERCFVYTGISDHFDYVLEGTEIPYYLATIDTINNTVTFKKYEK